MKTRLLSFLLALALLAGLTACTPPTPASTPAADTVTFVDDLGREAVLPGEITRLVSSSPLAQYVIYAIAPDLLVGLSGKWDSRPEEFLPEPHLSLPYLGQLYSSSDLNVEALAQAGPQVIIDIGEVKKSSVDDLNTLQAQTGIPTVFLSATLETMPDTYRKLGRLLGREAKAEELASFCERVYSRTVSIMEQVGDDRVSCLYVLGEEGLNVLAASSYHAELVDLLCDNLAVVDSPLSKGTGNTVTMEQIALWDPDFVIFAPGSIYSSVESMSPWNRLSAIVNGRYVEVPDAPLNWTGMPPSVQRYLGLIWLPAVLYPEYCDYDVQAEITAFYRLFFGCELTEEQYASVTAHAFLR